MVDDLAYGACVRFLPCSGQRTNSIHKYINHIVCRSWCHMYIYCLHTLVPQISSDFSNLTGPSMYSRWPIQRPHMSPWEMGRFVWEKIEKWLGHANTQKGECFNLQFHNKHAATFKSKSCKFGEYINLTKLVYESIPERKRNSTYCRQKQPRNI